MNLPFFKRFNKKVVPLYYLVLILRDEKAEAVVFEEISGMAKVIGQREQQFSSSIDEISPDELLEALDKAISGAEISLPENIQTQKTIFGVKESWTTNDQIKNQYLAKLKKASEELGLVPIGFLVISQAIAHLLQKEEGIPVSAILAEINKKSITVTLLRSGKSIETKSSEIHDSITFTVDTLLKHFNTSEILPSRIIIFNGKEDYSQEFISHTWSKSLPFLHLPQVTNLPRGFDAKAVLFGAATQMGFEVLEKNLPEEPHPEHELTEKDFETVKEEKLTEESKTYKNFGAENFGFAKDVDIAKMEFKEQHADFPSGNVSDKGNIPGINSIQTEEKVKPIKIFNKIFSVIKNSLIIIFGFIFSFIQKINFKKIAPLAPKGKFRLIISTIVISIIVLICSYYLFLKATITITLDPKIVEQNKSVVFSTTGTTDPASNTIKGKFVTVSEDGSVSTATTGTKDIGTSAKGTVTIFNSLTQSKTLANGTILKSSNGLEFTLDSSVTINAVASHSADETVTPVKVTANVTASQLGKEFNLPSGTKFSISSYDTSDLIAKNDNPFSGGTKKTVTVASKNDSTKLETDIVKQLESKAIGDLQKQLGGSSILLPKLISETLSKKSLNVKIGDEASQITLTGTVEYQGISYDKKDLTTLSQSLLSKDVLPNQEIDYNNIKASVLNIKNSSDEEIDASLNVKGLLLPKIDKNKLTNDLKGKSFKVTEDALYKISQVSNVIIKLSPNLPFLPKNLPIMEKNITILTKING